MADSYRALFRDASAVIAVSRAMERRLVAMGAPADKVHWNPYGVDCRSFRGADPATAAPVFLAVGRFTAKKAPHLTLLAFSEVHRAFPGARLRMIGFGPLMDVCSDLIRGLGLGGAVTILGPSPPEVVREEMRRARCFVQHSVTAANGDAEGTPVAVLEAGASGLPVVSTRHAGIPDVVIEGRTGFLVDEHDVPGMAAHMLRLARDPNLAGTLGREARRRVEAEFSLEKRIGRLWGIIESCLPRPGAPGPLHRRRSGVAPAPVASPVFHNGLPAAGGPRETEPDRCA
jgi:glycosyltransferase involved in cell wall biosynthesis